MSQKMKLKDVIFIAIFSVLFFAVMLVAVAVLGSTPVTFFFTHGVGAVPCGIIYMYVRAKVPRKGSVLLMCTLVALIAFCLGITWPSALGLFIGGIFAEIISAVGKYTNKLWNLIGYIVFICDFWLGQALYMILGTEMFMNSMVRQGTDLEFAQSLVDFVSGPMFIVCLLATIVLAALGGFLGYTLFKKHFSKLEA